MTRWSVPLEGGSYDLTNLASRTWSDATVTHADGEGLLTSPIFETMTNPSDVHVAAKELVKRLNDVAGLDFQRYVGVHRGDAVFDDSGPERKMTTFGRSGGVALIGIVSVGVSTPTLAERAYALAPTHKVLDDALRAFGAADWVGWYKVWEIVREQIDPVAEDCVSAAEIERFTRTANHQAAAGDAARHARANTQPPKNPMSELEGQGTAGRLIACLVRHIE